MQVRHGRGTFEIGISNIGVIFSRVKRWPLLFLILPIGALAQTETNLEQFESLADSLLEGRLGQLAPSFGFAMVCSLTPEHRLNWFFQKEIAAAFSASRPVYLACDIRDTTAEQAGVRVGYRPLKLSVKYADLSDEIVERTFELAVFLQLLAVPENHMIWQGEVAGSKSDRVARKLLDKLENKEISFTVGRQGRRKGASRFFAPLIVSSTAGIIVYLFYSLRSR